MTHYLKIDMDQFQARMKDFTQRNIQWIKKVGRDVLDKSQLTVDSFVKGLIGGTIFFDELCLTVACRAFNVHCILLLDGSYWTTRPNNQLSDCLLRLAYVGDYGFKEICAENTAVINEEATLEGNDSSESSELSGEDDEDLLGTGILTESAESSEVTENSDPKEKSDLTEKTDSNDVDKKPLVMFMPPVDVHNTKDDPIVITDSDEDEIDVKPVIKFKPMSTAVGEPIVISDSESEADKNKNDAAAAASLNASIPQVKRYSRIKRDRNYTCYLCLQQFDMQSSFVTHFNSDHADTQYKCDFCDTYFESSNGLFKHERSHLYLKYKCDVCLKLFQFPYQLAAHKTQHTGLRKHQCSMCEKKFGSKCAKVFHEKSHNVHLKCDLCPKSTEKEFSNSVALGQHQRGMHGPGWTAFCGDNFKWKSKYTRHRSTCKRCIKHKADKKLARFSFLCHMDLTEA